MTSQTRKDDLVDFKNSRTFRKRLVFGYVATLALSAAIAVTSIILLRGVAAKKDLVIYDTSQELIVTEKLRASVEKKISLLRGYLIYDAASFLTDALSIEARIQDELRQLNTLPLTQGQQAILNDVARANDEYNRLNTGVTARFQAGEKVATLLPILENVVRPTRQRLEHDLDVFSKLKEDELSVAKTHSLKLTSQSFRLIIVITSIALVLASSLALVLTRALSRLYTSALKATRLREEILGVVAHDLRSPLTAIRMNTNLLERMLKQTGENGQTLLLTKNIDQVAIRMNRLIQDLLDFEKIETGHLSLELRPVPTQTLLKNVVEVATALATVKKINIKTHFDSAPSEIYCDPDRLLQVFANLIGNAVKFAPSGTTVTIGASTTPEFTQFWVKDMGPGISPEQGKHIFERHWQAQATAHKGNGLGLAIVKGIIEAHQGEIWVTSELGHGCLISFIIQNHLAQRKPYLSTSREDQTNTLNS